MYFKSEESIYKAYKIIQLHKFINTNIKYYEEQNKCCVLTN